MIQLNSQEEFPIDSTIIKQIQEKSTQTFLINENDILYSECDDYF
jgi:hypothetical protein